MPWETLAFGEKRPVVLQDRRRKACENVCFSANIVQNYAPRLLLVLTPSKTMRPPAFAVSPIIVQNNAPIITYITTTVPYRS